MLTLIANQLLAIGGEKVVVPVCHWFSVDPRISRSSESPTGSRDRSRLRRQEGAAKRSRRDAEARRRAAAIGTTLDPQVAEFWTLVRGRGQAFDAGTARLEEGEENECHANTLRLWRSDRGSVCTGFALFSDALWRPHSWVRDASGDVVETTEICDAYFGYEFDDRGAELFASGVK